MIMKTIHFPLSQPADIAAHRINPTQAFMRWCTDQQKNRIAWSAAMVAIHGCALTPLTLIAIMLAGNNLVLWPFAIAAITMTLVSNLAALPTRFTIPIFFLSILIDLSLIGIAIAQAAGNPATGLI